MTYKPLLSGSEERAQYGCTITFENAQGRTWVIHQQGPPETGLRQACDLALAQDDTFRIVSYSTPETVYRDLHGREIQAPRTTPALPELYITARLGLRHLLHPRLIAASDAKRKDSHLRSRYEAERKRG